MSETAFVEEYRKELEATGFPFSQCRPLTTSTGYSLPMGVIVDASVYYDDAKKLPRLTAIEKADLRVTFTVGEYLGIFDFHASGEVVELQTEAGLFGGILVVDQARCKSIQSWRSGTHLVKTPPSFCLRCLEYFPPLGVQRFRSDSGELFSGHVAILAGKGGVMNAKKAGGGFDYVEVHFTGDPTWLIRHKERGLPVQSVVCVDASGNTVELVPGRAGGIEIVTCNTAQGNLFDDALRINAIGSNINISLAGL